MTSVKKKIQGDQGNCRLVSLMPVLSKLMECIILVKIVKHIEGQALLSKNQHDFCKDKPYLTNLLEIFESVNTRVPKFSLPGPGRFLELVWDPWCAHHDDISQGYFVKSLLESQTMSTSSFLYTSLLTGAANPPLLAGNPSFGGPFPTREYATWIGSGGGRRGLFASLRTLSVRPPPPRLLLWI